MSNITYSFDTNEQGWIGGTFDGSVGNTDFGGSGPGSIKLLPGDEMTQTIYLDGPISGFSYFTKTNDGAIDGNSDSEVRYRFDMGIETTITSTPFVSDWYEEFIVFAPVNPQTITITIKSVQPLAGSFDTFVDDIKVNNVKSVFIDPPLLSPDVTNIGYEYESKTYTIRGGVPPYNILSFTKSVNFNGVLVNASDTPIVTPAIAINPPEFKIKSSGPINSLIGPSAIWSLTYEDSSGINQNINAIININPALVLNPVQLGTVTYSLFDLANGIPPVTSNLTSAITKTGGTGPQFNYSISPSGSQMVGIYGTLNIANQSLVEGEYIYTIDTLPSSVGTYFDTFQIQVADSVNVLNGVGLPDIDIKTVTIQYTVTGSPNFVVLQPPMGTVIKTEGVVGPGTNTNLSGTIQTLNGASPFVYRIENNNTLVNSVAIPNFGTFSINSTTGVYIFVPTNPNNIIQNMTKTFTIRVTDNNGTVGTTTYNVNVKINQKVTLPTLESSLSLPIGYVSRTLGVEEIIPGNIIGEFTATGGRPPYTYSIVAPSVGIYGVLSITTNNDIACYTYMINSFPTSLGIFNDNFTFRVTDADMGVSIIPFYVEFTINPAPRVPLPIVTDVESRDTITYWDIIIHLFKTSNDVKNTEALVIGETGETVDNVIVVRNTSSDVLRELFKATAVEKSDIGKKGRDVVTNIRNNTKRSLNKTSDLNDDSGITTYSVDSTPPDLEQKFKTGSINTPIVEIPDILSSDHTNFLLNRYRSNIAEVLLVFFNSNSSNAELTKSANQIVLLLNLGITNIILIRLNPIIGFTTVDDFKIIINNVLNATQTGLSSSINYNMVEPNVQYNSSTNTYTNGDLISLALATIPENPSDESTFYPLRILITGISNNTVSGTIIYSLLSPLIQSSITFKSSRLFSPDDRTLTVTTSRIGDSLNKKQVISIGGNDPNVKQLKEGDVLYSNTNTLTFIQPNNITLLMSVVCDFVRNPATGPIFLQIGDGDQYPNNPVFTGEVTSISKRYNSTNLQLDPPAGSLENEIMHGFDYILNIDLTTGSPEDKLSAAPLEEYKSFPILGLVTIYCGRSDPTKPSAGIGAYGRGVVIAKNST